MAETNQKIRIVVLVEPSRLPLWHHFVNHYADRVDEIHAFVHCADESVEISGFRIPGVTRVLHWPHPFSCTRWGITLGGYAASEFSGGYLMPIDSDEIVYEDPRDWVRQMQCDDSLFVRGWFVDRFAAGGRLVAIQPSPSIEEQFPVMCEATKLLVRGDNRKVVLTRWPHWSCIHYFSDDSNLEARELPGVHPAVHHYKWDDTVIPRMRERALVLAKEGVSYQTEPIRVLWHHEYHGRIRVEDFNIIDWNR